MINSQEEYNSLLVKHLNSLYETATAAAPNQLLQKIERYYKGKFNKNSDKVVNQRNIINGIVETKTTLIIDSQITTSVVPASKSMVDMDNALVMHKIADILDDGVKDVFRKNRFDAWRQSTVRDLIKRVAISEVYWDAEEMEIRLKRVPFTKFKPDPNCLEVKDANYICIEETWSPITLKAKYPEHAEKIDKYCDIKEAKSTDANQKSGVVTAEASGQTNMAFTYNDPSYILNNLKDIKLVKVYLKDNSTFDAAELSEKGEINKENLAELSAKYPNGRMVLYLPGAKDVILEDKPIDYSFGYPVVVCYNVEGETVWDGTGDVELLFEVQDRINRAYSQTQKMVGKAGSWLVNDPHNGLTKEDFQNETILEGENIQTYGMPQVVTNNTTDKLNLMIDYTTMLKEDSLEIVRLNEQLVSGTQEEQTTSGEQVKALNESPLVGIRALQRNYKLFLVEITEKIIALMQQYYVTPRMIRVAEGQKFIRLPAQGSTQMNEAGKPEPVPIEVYEKGNEGIELVETIKGDISIGRYEVEVICGSERPRSKSENANLLMQLHQSGMLGQGAEPIIQILNELDVPGRKMIIERLKAQEESTPEPTIFDNEVLMKSFTECMKALEGFTGAKRQLLAKFGFNDKPDSLEDAPVQEVTKESAVKDVVRITPALISDDPSIQAAGQQMAHETDMLLKSQVNEHARRVDQ